MMFSTTNVGMVGQVTEVRPSSWMYVEVSVVVKVYEDGEPSMDRAQIDLPIESKGEMDKLLSGTTIKSSARVFRRKPPPKYPRGDWPESRYVMLMFGWDPSRPGGCLA